LDRSGFHPTLVVEQAPPPPDRYAHFTDDQSVEKLQAMLASAIATRDAHRRPLLPPMHDGVVIDEGFVVPDDERSNEPEADGAKPHGVLEYADSFARHVAEDIVRPVGLAVETVENIHSSGRFSNTGKRTELRLTGHNGLEQLARARANRDKVESLRAAREAALLKPKPTTTGQRWRWSANSSCANFATISARWTHSCWPRA
jgi:hypothetical protein